MRRVMHWENHLAEWADHLVGARFKWGRTDCVTLALRGLSVIYDDPEIARLATWSTLRGAMRELYDVTPPSWIEEHGGEVIPLPTVRAGDLVTGWKDQLPTVYLGVGGKLISSTENEGVQLTTVAPLLDVDLLAWRLP